MAGINTYIKEYGDKTFNEEKFNEIDNVILSSVVYLNFDGIVPKNKKPISLCEAGNIFLYKYNYFDVSKLGIAQKVNRSPRKITSSKNPTQSIHTIRQTLAAVG